MGLAGNMKLSTFITVVVCGGVLGGVGLWALWPEPEPEPEIAALAEALEAMPSTAELASQEEGRVLPWPSAVDDALLQVGSRAAPMGKINDATPDAPYRIKAYQDKGNPRVNRAQVDLDRDDKWDLMVTFTGDGTLRAMVSPDDNGQHILPLSYGPDGWSGAGSSPEATPTASANRPVPWPAALDKQLLGLPGFTAPGGKIKDVDPKAAYKINAYQDSGHAHINRAKIDLDRDEKWDLKATFAGTSRVELQFAPLDDEAYTHALVLDPSGWSGDGIQSAAPAAEAASGAEAAPASDPVDQALMAYVGRDLGSKKLKDVTKGKPFKINVYQDAGNATANRAKIDLDRDDRWDIKVDFKQPPTRQVSPNDDESYTVEQSWVDGGWR